MHTISLPESARERGRAAGLDRPIDPATTAAITVDFQRFFVDDGHPMGTADARDALQNANRVNAAVRKAGGTVVICQHSFAPPGVEPEQTDAHELHPGSVSYELNEALQIEDGDVRIVKHTSSPLHPLSASGLPELVKERGIETLIITGVASNGCCDCLARDAAQHGLNVVFVSDASAAMSDDEHNATLLNLAIYYAQVLDAAEVEAALSGASTAAER